TLRHSELRKLTPIERRRRRFLPVFFQAGVRYSRCSFSRGKSPKSVVRCEEVVMPPEPIRTGDEVLRRVQGEFLEMPSLRLTEAQARRLWGLDAAYCDALLATLVEAKFLFRTRDGAFMRVEHALPVKATIRSRKKIAAA